MKRNKAIKQKNKALILSQVYIHTFKPLYILAQNKQKKALTRVTHQISKPTISINKKHK